MVDGCGVQEFVVDLLRWILGRLMDLVSVRSFVLFGSYARGDFRCNSDVDVLVISDDFPDRLSVRYDIVRPIFLEAKRHPLYREIRGRGFYPTFNYILYRSDEIVDTPPIFLDLVEDAVILYDDGTFKSKIDMLRSRLRELGAERRVSKRGYRYWILKPDLKWGEVIEL